MSAYTTITLPRSLVCELEALKREMRARSYGEVISRLISLYRREKAREFVRDVLRARELDLSDVRRVVSELRRLPWARF